MLPRAGRKAASPIGPLSSAGEPANQLRAPPPAGQTRPTANTSEPHEKRYSDGHGIDPRLVSGSSAKRPEPSGINAMPLVHKNSTGQPWARPGKADNAPFVDPSRGREGEAV